MPSVLLLAAMATAHPDDPSHHVGATAAADVELIVDLSLEGALLSRGLDPSRATRLTAQWAAGIAAPTRTRAEGRGAGWAFDETEVRFRNEQVVDGEVLDVRRGQATASADDTLCTVLHGQSERPIALAPMDPRARERGPADTHDDVLDVTWAASDEATTALVMLQPGESATVVELDVQPGTRPRRRARLRRRVEIDTHRASLRVVENDEQHAKVCLTVHPVVPVASVPRSAPHTTDSGDALSDVAEDPR